MIRPLSAAMDIENEVYALCVEAVEAGLDREAVADLVLKSLATWQVLDRQGLVTYRRPEERT